MVRSPLIADVAVAAAYFCRLEDDPFREVVEFLSAYTATLPLTLQCRRQKEAKLLVVEHDRGLLTFHNDDGFKINFVGSWDMPFGFYRASTALDPRTGALRRSAALSAVAHCDELEYYGNFLKLMGMAEMDTRRRRPGSAR